MEKKLYLSLFEHSAIPIAITDLDGKYVTINKAFTDYLGYTLSDLQGKTYIDISHENELEPSRRKIDQLLNGDIPYFQIEKRFIHKNGHILWGLITVNLLKEENQQPLYRVAQLQDITEKKIIEQQLQESGKLYRLIAENSYDIIATHNLNEECEYISPSVERRLGFQPNELIGLNPFHFLHPDDVKHTINQLKGLTASTETRTIMHRLLHKQGHSIWFESHVKCLFENGNPTQFLVVSREITKRIEIIKKLEKQIEE